MIPETVEISSGNLTVTRNNAVSNGIATNAVQAIVTGADNNPMSGQTVTFTADNNANVNTVVGVTGIDGIATAEITNTRAGITRVTATVGSTSQFINVTFVADSGNLDTTASSLIASPSTIVADGTTTAQITLTLRDANNNLVPAQTVTFASSLANSSLGAVTNHGDGTYTAALSGVTAGVTDITASVGGNAFAVTAAQVTLVPLFAAMQGTLSVNGATFAINSGFPTTGFTGAIFQVLINGNVSNNSNYTWSSDKSWVSVDNNGNVSFTGVGDASTVTITATPLSVGTSYTYTFALSKWFTPIVGTMNWSTANTTCSGSLPRRLDMTNVTSGTGSRVGGSASLWPEWGRIDVYTGSDFAGPDYWTSEATGTSNHFIVGMWNGGNNNWPSTNNQFVACMQNL